MKKGISKQTVAGILCVIGIGSIAASVGYIRPALTERGEQIQSENEQLKVQLNQVRELVANEAEYVSQTAVYDAESNAILANYPAEVREEDAILYAKELEDASDYEISVVGINPGSLIYANGVSDVGDGTETTEDTVSEETTVETTTDSVDLGILDEASVPVPDYQLFSMSVSYDFTGSYKDMKNITEKILSDPDKRNISEISLSYDSETGELIGNMSMNLYYLTGTEKTYAEPDAGNIKKGKKNIFDTKK